jgi:uncharacterized protein
MPPLLTVFLALVAGVGVGYLLFMAVERRKTGGKTAAEIHAELQEYREQVQEHFTKTSDLFQNLTVQYRELYDHLANGAQDLCEPAPGTPMLGISDKGLLPQAAPDGTTGTTKTGSPSASKPAAHTPPQKMNRDDESPAGDEEHPEKPVPESMPRDDAKPES